MAREVVGGTAVAAGAVGATAPPGAQAVSRKSSSKRLKASFRSIGSFQAVSRLKAKSPAVGWGGWRGIPPKRTVLHLLAAGVWRTDQGGRPDLCRRLTRAGTYSCGTVPESH